MPGVDQEAGGKRASRDLSQIQQDGGKMAAESVGPGNRGAAGARKFTWKELSKLNERHNAHVAYRGKVSVRLSKVWNLLVLLCISVLSRDLINMVRDDQ